MARRVRSRAASPSASTASSAKGARRRAATGPRLGAGVTSPGRFGVEVAEIQRTRLLAGALSALDEHGYAQMTVAQITRRSRVSRRTFYELFENREACLLALLEDAVAMIERELAAAELGGLAWRERIHGGLWVILCFCDREAALARVLVDQSSQGGRRVLRRRDELQARLVAIVDEGRGGGARGAQCSPLTAEGLVGAAVAIVGARLSYEQRREPLAGLLGELMSMVVLPYLGAAVASRERSRSAPALPVGNGARRESSRPVAMERDPLEGVRMRMTYRTARVLAAIAAQPGVSNRLVGEHAGIHDQGQISKLLARLERLALVENAGEGHVKGESNAWSLTRLGWQITQRFSPVSHSEQGIA
ncbi:MAG TPA: TetR/AcrR family transcriptional regulator [Solirubrobacteraceae bacterium]|nr:TetR/AcrR family transcriptional regulator [Solirubrobacteraceae bacterium]